MTGLLLPPLQITTNIYTFHYLLVKNTHLESWITRLLLPWCFCNCPSVQWMKPAMQFWPWAFLSFTQVQVKCHEGFGLFLPWVGIWTHAPFSFRKKVVIELCQRRLKTLNHYYITAEAAHSSGSCNFQVTSLYAFMHWQDCSQAKHKWYSLYFICYMHTESIS